uniref:Uncharacterized protein n=1 Tax=Glossina pallidipes TaxID=7398 RepID=A0A1A9ZCC3_GLOPL
MIIRILLAQRLEGKESMHKHGCDDDDTLVSLYFDPSFAFSWPSMPRICVRFNVSTASCIVLAKRDKNNIKSINNNNNACNESEIGLTSPVSSASPGGCGGAKARFGTFCACDGNARICTKFCKSCVDTTNKEKRLKETNVKTANLWFTQVDIQDPALAELFSSLYLTTMGNIFDISQTLIPRKCFLHLIDVNSESHFKLNEIYIFSPQNKT